MGGKGLRPPRAGVLGCRCAPLSRWPAPVQTEGAGSGRPGLSPGGSPQVPVAHQGPGRGGGCPQGPAEDTSGQRIRVLCKQFRRPPHIHSHFLHGREPHKALGGHRTCLWSVCAPTPTAPPPPPAARGAPGKEGRAAADPSVSPPAFQAPAPQSSPWETGEGQGLLGATSGGPRGRQRAGAGGAKASRAPPLTSHHNCRKPIGKTPHTQPAVSGPSAQQAASPPSSVTGGWGGGCWGGCVAGAPWVPTPQHLPHGCWQGQGVSLAFLFLCVCVRVRGLCHLPAPRSGCPWGLAGSRGLPGLGLWGPGVCLLDPLEEGPCNQLINSWLF